MKAINPIRRHGSPKKSRETNLTATLRFIYLRLSSMYVCVCVLDVLCVRRSMCRDRTCTYTVLSIINVLSFDTNCMANTYTTEGNKKIYDNMSRDSSTGISANLMDENYLILYSSM